MDLIAWMFSYPAQGLHSPCTVLGCIQWRSLTKCSNNSRVRVVRCTANKQEMKSILIWRRKNIQIVRVNIKSDFIPSCVCLYLACVPSGNYSSPADSGFHSRCDTLLCCRWWSTPSSEEQICSHPRAVEDTEAEIHHTVLFINAVNLLFNRKSVMSSQAKEKTFGKSEYQLKDEIKISGAKWSHFSSKRVFEWNELQRNATGVQDILLNGV